MVARQGPKILENLQSEIDILAKIRHENVVTLYTAVKESKYWFLVLEYCDGGDLHDYIRKHGKLDESMAQVLMLAHSTYKLYEYASTGLRASHSNR